MEIEIALSGDRAVEETSDLERWLRESRIDDVNTIGQQSAPPGPGEQGPSLLAIIGVVLGAKATVELVRSIHRWIETRRREITITVKSGENELVIDAKNPADITLLLDKATAIITG